MWYIILNKLILKKINLLNFLNLDEIEKKLFKFDNYNIENNVKLFLSSNLIFTKPINNNLNKKTHMYLNNISFLKKYNISEYKYIFILKITKKQSFIIILKNNKIIFSRTNGFFLKKLNIKKKSQKKDNKLSILNLKNGLSFCNTNNINKIIFNMVGLKKNSNKLVYFLKNFFKNKMFIYINSLKVNFFKNKFKKVKSIKRKLRKKYTL